MAAPSREVTGTLRPDGTLELDGKLDLPPGRVKVRVEPAPLFEQRPGEGVVDFVLRMRAELEAAGHRFRTKEEIDADLAELDAGWEERERLLDRARGRSDEIA